MRIIGGLHKGRKFRPPKNLPVRPTTDFAKEGLFNILQNQLNLADINVLDLCAGTGNMSFEFASRGAKKISSVDQHFGCVKFMKNIARELQFTNLTVIKSEIFRFIDKAHSTYQFDLIFADPPYGMEGTENLPNSILNSSLISKEGIFILEHGREFSFDNHLSFLFSRKYGNVNFTFFQALPQ